MKFSKELKIGLTAIIAIIIFIWGVNYLKGKNIFSVKNSYFVKYERVDGLKLSSPVVINGFKVGQVDQIRYLTDSRNVLVEFFIENDLQLPISTQAKLVSLDLMSPKSIELIIPEKIEGYHQNMDTLPGFSEPGLTELIADLGGKLEGTIEEINTTLVGINEILNDQTRHDIQLTLSNLKNISGDVDRKLQKGGEIHTILQNMQAITQNIEQNNAEISGILGNLNMVSGQLSEANIDETITTLDTTLVELNYILTKVNKGEGTVGSLIYEDSLHINLVSLTKSLDMLLIDLKEHPGRYVNFSLFGGNKD